MHLKLQREETLNGATLGTLFINGAQFCFTLEDAIRERAGVPVEVWKVPAQTCIPQGTYKVMLTFSNRFQKILPQLMSVPGFQGIRIHSGNAPSDTEGCILVGRTRTSGTVGESRLAMADLMEKLTAAEHRNEGIDIEVLNPAPPQTVATPDPDIMG